MRKHVFDIENSRSKLVIFKNGTNNYRAVLVTGDEEEFIGLFYKSSNGYKKYCWNNRINKWQGVVGSTINDLGTWVASWGEAAIRSQTAKQYTLSY